VAPALAWLSTNESSDGSYGPYFEEQAAAAAYALWLNDSRSHYAASSYAYLSGQLSDSSTWFWGSFGEADVPGEALFSIATTQHLSLVQDLSGVSSRLLQFQQPNGGFEGFYGVPSTSVDTAMALWGLSTAQTMPRENRTAAFDYLLTLQNPDGSFNLTRTVSADPLSSLGPDPISITALVALVLRDSGFTLCNPAILKALGFLTTATLDGFNGPGHVYGASLSTLAFLENYRPHEADSSLAYLTTQQNRDGGFGDVNRSTNGSDALDTGWAAIALQLGVRETGTLPGPLNCPPTARFSFAPKQPANGTPVAFDGRSSSDEDGDELSYAWTFGDGGSASGPTVAHVYAGSGVYTVTLTVTDSGVNPDALSSTTWLSITVQQTQGLGRTATSPSPLTTSAELALVVVLALVVAGYLMFRMKRRRPNSILPTTEHQP